MSAPEFEDFSSGYYRVEMTVAPYDQGPTVQNDVYDYIERQHYTQTNANPLFRLGLDGNPYFTPKREAAIPSDHIGVPTSWFADNTMAPTYDECEVFVLKPSYAYMIEQAKHLGEYFDPRSVEDDTDANER